MKTLVQHIKEDFKISRKTKFSVFDNIFQGIDIYKWNGNSTAKPKETIKEFASRIYNTEDENVYMKNFFLLTIKEFFIALANDERFPTYVDNYNRYVNIVSNGKVWSEYKSHGVPVGWYDFVRWLIEKKENSINEDFKLSKNTKFIKDGSFESMFPNVNIADWDYQGRNSNSIEDEIKNFASRVYHDTKDENVYMKKFFLETIDHLIMAYKINGMGNEAILVGYRDKAKTLKYWGNIMYECISSTWWDFIIWLFEQRKKQLNENFKISKHVKLHNTNENFDYCYLQYKTIPQEDIKNANELIDGLGTRFQNQIKHNECYIFFMYCGKNKTKIYFITENGYLNPVVDFRIVCRNDEKELLCEQMNESWNKNGLTLKFSQAYKLHISPEYTTLRAEIIKM